eukprot:4157567-Pyramimonas_sp.AAC.1
MASQQARMITQLAAKNQVSAAFIFLDLKAAFHRIMRQMASRMQYLEDEPEAILNECDIPICLVPLASHILSQPALLDDQRVDPHLATL